MTMRNHSLFFNPFNFCRTIYYSRQLCVGLFVVCLHTDGYTICTSMCINNTPTWFSSPFHFCYRSLRRINFTLDVKKYSMCKLLLSCIQPHNNRLCKCVALYLFLFFFDTSIWSVSNIGMHAHSFVRFHTHLHRLECWTQTLHVLYLVVGLYVYGQQLQHRTSLYT